MAEKKPAKAAKAHRTYYIATGRRKTAVARVRVTEGQGQVLINGKRSTTTSTKTRTAPRCWGRSRSPTRCRGSTCS